MDHMHGERKAGHDGSAPEPVGARHRMDVTTKPGSIQAKDNDSKGSLLDITFVNATAANHLPTSVLRGGNALRKAKMRKGNMCRGHFYFATFALKTLVFSVCGDIGEDTISFIADMAHHRVDKRMDCPNEKEKRQPWDARQASEATFSCVLYRALSQRTRLAVAQAKALPPNGPAAALTVAWSKATSARCADVGSGARRL